MIYCVHVGTRACVCICNCVHMRVSMWLHVHMVTCVCDMMYSQQHSIPPAIINFDVQPNVNMYGRLHDLLLQI